MPRPNAFARKQSSALLGEIVQDLDRHHEITAPQRNALGVGGGRA
jgi:hypothetical protein